MIIKLPLTNLHFFQSREMTLPQDSRADAPFFLRMTLCPVRKSSIKLSKSVLTPPPHAHLFTPSRYSGHLGNWEAWRSRHSGRSGGYNAAGRLLGHPSGRSTVGGDPARKGNLNTAWKCNWSKRMPPHSGTFLFPLKVRTFSAIILWCGEGSKSRCCSVIRQTM